MAEKYKKAQPNALQVEEGREAECIIRYYTDSNMQDFIPIDEDSVDYREYLAWVAEGNTIEPADQ